MRPRLRSFLLFLLFLVLVQVFSGGLEWLLTERLRIVQAAGRPWRPTFFYVWEGTAIIGGLAATLIVARLGPRGWRRLGFDTRHAVRHLLTGLLVGLIVMRFSSPK